MNGEQIILEAVKMATDPVVAALNKLGFREKGSKGSTRKLRLVAPGSGYNMASLINTLNYVLSKDKQIKDQLFNPPWYNGYYVCSSADYHGVHYDMEIGVGVMLLHIILPKNAGKRIR